MEKRFIAKIPSLQMSMAIEKEEFSTFVAHFGRLGNIEIYDTMEKEILLDTVGVCINMFYPETENRNLAIARSKQYYQHFRDYNFQRKQKYPKGRLKELYIALLQSNE